MNRMRLTKVLVVAGVGLVLAAGSVAAIAASDGGGDKPGERAAAQEQTPEATPAPDAGPCLGLALGPSKEPAGVAVRHVVPESPAADAGLERGDVITAVDGKPVSEVETLASAVEAKAVGDTVTLTVIKNGVEEADAEASDIEATLEARPEEVDIKEQIGDGLGKLFERFVDGQFRYLDENGNNVTIEAAAGSVTSVSADEITIDVNGDEGERTFSIPDGVELPEGLEAGDQAAVVLRDGAVEHIIGGGFPLPFLPGFLPEGLPPLDGEGGFFPHPFGEGPDESPEESPPAEEGAAPEA